MNSTTFFWDPSQNSARDCWGYLQSYAALLPVATLAEVPSTVDASALLERRRRQASYRRLRESHDRQVEPRLRASRGAHRHLRSGRDALGRASNVQPGCLLRSIGFLLLVKAKPELANVEPFKTVLSGDREAMAKLTTHDLEKILFATLTGMTVDTFASGSQEVDRGGQGRSLEASLYRAYLPTDAGSAELPACQWLQDLHRHRRGPGLRARLFRAGLWHPARASGRHCRRHHLQL